MPRLELSLSTLVVAGIVFLVFTTAEGQSASAEPKLFSAIAQECAPTVDPKMLAAVAQTESHFEPFALRNNTKHLSVLPASKAAGVQQAIQWISEGNSVDLGLMQINSGNLAKLGLTVETALDSCRSLQASARVLSAAYAQGSSAVDRQAALLIALSRYNTGHSLAGLANGYVGQVLAAQDDARRTNLKSSYPAISKQSEWNIWAVASAAQHDGAAWLIGSQDTSNFLIGAGAQPSGEPHALSQEPGAAPGR